MTINKNKLQQYTTAFIKYELDVHGIDIRETLEGSTMRLKKNAEGYKYDVYEKYHKEIEQGPPFTEKILRAFPGKNLASYHQKSKLEDLVKYGGADDFEKALELLYAGDNDELAFQTIIEMLGGYFDIMGFLFFLKDKEKYLPIRSSLFDDKFALLGLNSELNGNCSWEKYMEFISWIREVQAYLIQNVNSETTLLDAHSFVWILDRTDQYISDNYEFVEHAKFGKGTIVGYKDDLVQVKFGKKQASFSNENAFETGILKRISVNTEEDVLSNEAVEVATALLQLIANRQLTVTYGELSQMTDSKPSPHLKMGELLDSINRRCDKLGLPYISAMVVAQDTRLPGEGFWKLCVDTFGYDENLEIEEIREQELVKIGKCDSWGKLAESLGIEMPEELDEAIPEEIEEDSGQPIIEGAKKQITINAYERDPKAKKKCKDYYMHKNGKITCQICGFDFGKVYGAEYANKIHIHHIKPISEIGQEYVVDPIKDLIPVCPNCHMIIHAGEGIEVDELRKHLEKTGIPQIWEKMDK